MEFILGAISGAAFCILLGKAGWFSSREEAPPAEHRYKYYYVCPIEDCTYSVDSNVESATDILAKQHEKTHEE